MTFRKQAEKAKGNQQKKERRQQNRDSELKPQKEPAGLEEGFRQFQKWMLTIFTVMLILLYLAFFFDP